MKKILLILALFMPTCVFAQSLGQSPVLTVFLNYSSTNVTTSAWTQLSAALPNDIAYAQIFDSSGQGLIFGQGLSGHEVALPVEIFPGGNPTNTAIQVTSGKRLVIKALTATANAGFLMINFFK